MSTLTYLTKAVLKDQREEIDGKILTRPTLLVTDGTAVIYACDVDIGIVQTTGYDIDQDLVNSKVLGSVLRNVPIARGNADVIYADAGSAVRLRKTTSGRYEIVGFSQEMPGTNIRIPVDLDTLAIGVIEDLSISSRALTLEELATYGGFGFVPLGSIAIFEGSTFVRLA